MREEARMCVTENILNKSDILVDVRQGGVETVGRYNN